MYIPTDDGRWVSEAYERLARVVKEYDDQLELRWIPPEHRTRDDRKPYAIMDIYTNTPVFFASELDTPEDILARLYAADNKYGKVIDRLDLQDMAAKALKDKEWEDFCAEQMDQGKFLLQSPLNRIRMNGKTFDDQRRVIR